MDPYLGYSCRKIKVKNWNERKSKRAKTITDKKWEGREHEGMSFRKVYVGKRGTTEKNSEKDNKAQKNESFYQISPLSENVRGMRH